MIRPNGHRSDETAPSSAEVVHLRAALARARVDAAERQDVISSLAGAGLSRLTALRDRLEPVFAEIPKGVDGFDPGLVGGDHPRLFVDMVAFVELGRDRHSFRLIQNTRGGRALLKETDDSEAMARAVTDYIARRLVEREQALSGEFFNMTAVPPAPETTQTVAAQRSMPPLPWLSYLMVFVFGAATGALALMTYALSVVRG
jgi:hypothetical protein